MSYRVKYFGITNNSDQVLILLQERGGNAMSDIKESGAGSFNTIGGQREEIDLEKGTNFFPTIGGPSEVQELDQKEFRLPSIFEVQRRKTKGAVGFSSTSLFLPGCWVSFLLFVSSFSAGLGGIVIVLISLVVLGIPTWYIGRHDEKPQLSNSLIADFLVGTRLRRFCSFFSLGTIMGYVACWLALYF